MGETPRSGWCPPRPPGVSHPRARHLCAPHPERPLEATLDESVHAVLSQESLSHARQAQPRAPDGPLERHASVVAIIGWIAFVAVSFVIGGSDDHRTRSSRPSSASASPAAATKVIDKAFTDADQPAEEILLIQARSGKLSGERSDRRRRRRDEAAAGHRVVSRDPGPSRWPRTAARRASVRQSAATPDEATTRSPRSRPPSTVDRRAPTRRCCVEEFGDATAGKAFDDKLASGLQEGGDPVDPDHADHPDRRVRRAARRRHPGAARH